MIMIRSRVSREWYAIEADSIVEAKFIVQGYMNNTEHHYDDGIIFPFKSLRIRHNRNGDYFEYYTMEDFLKDRRLI